MYLVIQKHFEDYSSLEAMMADVLADHRDVLVNTLEQFFPEFKSQMMNEFEGGIDEWWHPSGSVMQGELGLIVELKIIPDGCLLSVYATGQSDYE